VKSLETVIRSHGGIARMSELIQAGYPPDFVLLSAQHHHIIRVRKGWYANTDVDPAAIRAWRVGGPLACVSALEYHGLGQIDPAHLHVHVSATASRLRTAADHRKRLAEHPDEKIVIHWSNEPPTGDGKSDGKVNRIAVSLDQAFAQARACRPRGPLFNDYQLENLAHAVGVL
jgi:hypothetical protein